MDLREIKGKQIALTRQIKKYEDGFAVQSQTSKRFYFVDNNGACTCPDCQTRQLKCKHAFAVQYYLQKITTKDGAVKIETKRLTYPQAWHAYNEAQNNEVNMFDKLLRDLVENIEESAPKNGAGRPSLSLREQLFCSTQKVYSQLSSRRAKSLYNNAKGKGLLGKAPHSNSVNKFFNRADITPILHKLIALSAAPLKTIETDFAIDSSGFRTTKFNDYCREKHDTPKIHKWLKAHVCTGVKTNIVSSVRITQENGADSPQFAPLVQETADAGFDMQEVSADKAYSSRDNLYLVAQQGGIPFIPFKKNARENANGSQMWKKMFHYFNYNQKEFFEHYHKRSNVESTFNMIKAKLGDCLKSKNFIAQKNELLAKILCHNIVVVIHEMFELGIETKFGNCH